MIWLLRSFAWMRLAPWQAPRWAVRRRCCSTLGVSRPTLRQAARVVEREGLLKVRRGNNGGYFAARPDAGFVEATVASYLEVLHAKPDDVTRVATALWVEAVAMAAQRQDERAKTLAERFRAPLRAIKAESGFAEIMAIETKIRRQVFDLIGSPYVELIFNINANFATREIAEPPAQRDGTKAHADFVRAWRKAMAMQLEAISDGDAEVAVLAARRCRELFHKRVWSAG